MKQGKFELHLEPCDIVKTAKDIGQMIKIQLQMRPKVQFTLKLDPELPTSLVTDE